MPLFKVCLVGAESTGKSTLAQALAYALRRRGYWAQATDEALRLFCDRYRRLPKLIDEALIFQAQLRAEQAIDQQPMDRLPANSSEALRFLICDSSPLLTAFTSRWYFADDTLLRPGLQHQTSYLHCYLVEPSLPWEPDGIQRDGPEVRTKFHADLCDFLRDQRIPYEAVALRPDVVSKGSGQAITMADQLLAKAGQPQRR